MDQHDVITTIGYLGVVCFGIVIGWFVYFINRFRKGDVQFSDLTTLIGIIGGGSVTAIFGDRKVELFAAYGLGLAIGFFAYFIVLLIFVRNSGGKFTWAWFLDGRRKKLDTDEEIPGYVRETPAPMAMQPTLADRVDALEGRLSAVPPAAMAPWPAPAAPQALAPSALSQILDQYRTAIRAVEDALSELRRRINETPPTDPLRASLVEKHNELNGLYQDLLAVQLRDILDSPDTRAAIAKLRGITSGLKQEADRMKQTADALATAAKVINQVTGLLGFIGGAFA